MNPIAALLGVTVIVGLVVPIYTDEVAWRFQMSRYLQDGGFDRNLGESCGGPAGAAPPFTMLPLRLFSSLATRAFDRPIDVRIAGILGALAALVLLAAIGRRLDAGRAFAWPMRAMAPALLGLGVLPFLLVWSRPENPVLLCLLATVLLGLVRSEARSGWRVAAIVALAAIGSGYQVKAVFYAPIFLWGIYVASAGPWRRVLRIAGIGAVLVVMALAYRYWAQRFACPDDPIIAAKIMGESDAARLIHAPLARIVPMMLSLLPNIDPFKYIALTLPNRLHMSNWLPPAGIGAWPVWLWTVGVVAGWGLAMIACTLAMANMVVRRRWPDDGRIASLAFLAIACPSGWALLQTNKNAYEASLYLPMLVVGMMAVLAVSHPGPATRRGVVGLVVAIASLSVLSQVALMVVYAGPLWRETHRGGYVEGQPFSISAFERANVDWAIRKAGRACGIDPDAPPPRLLIDDRTYFIYAAGYRPMYRLGVLSGWNGRIADPLAWMRRQHSGGAVIGCRFLPPALRARARVSGDYCCLGPP